MRAPLQTLIAQTDEGRIRNRCQRACFIAPACQPGAADACPMCRVADHYAALRSALRGVIRVADRKTVEFDAARAALADAEDHDRLPDDVARWRPIDTMPKHGEGWFLVWVPDNQCTFAVYRAADGTLRDWCSGAGETFRHTATLWCPRPPSPNEADQLDAVLRGGVPQLTARAPCPDGCHVSETRGYGHQRCSKCGYEWEFNPPPPPAEAAGS